MMVMMKTGFEQPRNIFIFKIVRQVAQQSTRFEGNVEEISRSEKFCVPNGPG